MDDPKNPTWKVPTRLRANARALRKNATDAERILWSALRNHRLNAIAFRRQVPIASYIADFMCHAARLVIELDGGQHFSDAAERADARRTAVIESHGYRVLRFSNSDVLHNREGVLETIIAAIETSAPSPTLPHKGGWSRRTVRSRQAASADLASNPDSASLASPHAASVPSPLVREGQGGGPTRAASASPDGSYDQ